MRSCSACGAHTGHDDDFCGTCNAYLGWDESTERRDTASPTPPPPNRPITASGPTAEPEAPDSGQPAAVQPARPVVPRPESNEPVATATPDATDGPPCPACGTPNPPERRFCRRCAAQLTAVPEPDKPRQRRASSRKPRDLARGIRRLVGLASLAAVVLVGVLLYPFGERIVQDVLDKTSQPKLIEPRKPVASAEVTGHPAVNATDGASNTYWGTPSPGEWIDFDFEHPFRLVTVLVSPGTSKNPAEFRTHARPTMLDIVITNANGETRTMTTNVGDQPQPQQVDIGISAVVHVRVVVRAATGLTDDKHIALREIEFFERP